jgi:glycosyltransferase involved in cell wall biosynthesis
MKFTLIMATVGRSVEVERFLSCLKKQTYRSFEVIIIDQNKDKQLTSIIDQYSSDFPILHLRSEKGLSKARNLGLLHAKGNIIAFPDDDCWYSHDLLRTIAVMFQRNPQLDGLTGRSIDADGKDSATKFDSDKGFVSEENVWTRGISFTIFLRKYVCDWIGGFDEEIGLGANSIYLSGEETDYLLRAIRKFKVQYNPAIKVYHPNPVQKYTGRVIQRAYKYGCGFGKVVVKHNYKFSFRVKALIRPLLGMLIYLLSFRILKSMYYWNSFRGRLRGML